MYSILFPEFKGLKPQTFPFRAHTSQMSLKTLINSSLLQSQNTYSNKLYLLCLNCCWNKSKNISMRHRVVSLTFLCCDQLFSTCV